ncbi:MAG: phosphoribosyl-ATP pyrophosphohydrolase [Candidatus Heimdallarchaeota archaeon]|nr:phosphoribosyl-ATP pyrophosphohydrolase [Candidatus Heimdallarchaeota archaeon]
MPKITYDKLVRDKIPEIIRNDGGEPRIYFIEDEQEFEDRLIQKLAEELKEFRSSKSLEELADMLEVIIALLNLQGKSFSDLEHIRRQKRQKNGSFTKGIVLKSVKR